MKTKTTLTWVASLSFLTAPAWAAQPVPVSSAPSPAKAGAPAGSLPATTTLAARAMPRVTTPAAETFELQQLLELAQSTNKGVDAAQANVDAATAAITTARAYPNPQVEVMYGRLHGKEAGVQSGNAPSYAFVQKFDYPNQRSLRERMAGRGLEASEAQRQTFRAELAGRVKTAYFQVLRRETELAAAREDLTLMRQIQERAKVRVDVGEAPRYELIKADTELLGAQKTLQTAELRVEQAKASLRQQVGGALPASFALHGSLSHAPNVPNLAVLRDTLQANNAELNQRRSEVERARLGVDYQRSLRWPEVAVRAVTNREPDNNVNQIGLVMTIPLWDRRSGPVGEATAQATQARTALEAREFELTQELSNAYQQYEITQAQVTALESGIVREAESALGVAEAAYRFGERGILDYLDAQRVLRNARSELITAQYELQVAAIQIEKLMSATPGAPTGAAPASAMPAYQTPN
ncbi:MULTISPECIES: TolC family protein [unclassified Cupriavidus]|uniref:TolC family protein n=1 Tax=unclassified Cupriavidus TaxID=2640874 RepID=UPI0010F45108|nr:MULTISPECIES: TolC family protein [unclassified Cupriavidus]MWL90160.1 TolC family protein [Cupriavidus sp. SW-Y-13]